MSKYKMPVLRRRPKLLFVALSVAPGLIHLSSLLDGFPKIRSFIAVIAGSALGIFVSQYMDVWEDEMQDVSVDTPPRSTSH